MGGLIPEAYVHVFPPFLPPPFLNPPGSQNLDDYFLPIMVEHVSGLRHENYPKSRARRNKVGNTKGRPRHLKATKSQHRGWGLTRSAEKLFEDTWTGVWQMDQKERPAQCCTSVVLLATAAVDHPWFIGCWLIIKALWFPTSSPSYSSPRPWLIFSCLLLFFLPSIPTDNLVSHTLTDGSLARQWAEHRLWSQGSCQNNPGAKTTSSFGRGTNGKGASKALALPRSCRVGGRET